jgi:sulfur carrier protein ThiS
VIYDIARGTIYDTVVIFVNNQPVPSDLKVKIKGGDIIVVTPFYSGG